MERITWKLTLPYVKYIANGNLLYVSGNSSRALYQPRHCGGGGQVVGEGDRKEVQKGEDICASMADSC